MSRAICIHGVADATICVNCLCAANAKLRAALERVDYYYNLNGCDDMADDEAVEIDVKVLREIHAILNEETK